MPRSDWRNQSCEDCEYRVDQWCKQGPHATLVAFTPHANDVNQNMQYLDACGQYEQQSETD